MSLKFSTGLRNHMLVTGSLVSALNGLTLVIFDGVEPASADDAPSGVQLVDIGFTTGGTPTVPQKQCDFLATVSADSIISKDANAWDGIIEQNGTATYYRLIRKYGGVADTNLASTTDIRVQGSVGTALADLNLASTALVVPNTQNIDVYNIVLPENC